MNVEVYIWSAIWFFLGIMLGVLFLSVWATEGGQRKLNKEDRDYINSLSSYLSRTIGCNDCRRSVEKNEFEWQKNLNARNGAYDR